MVRCATPRRLPDGTTNTGRERPQKAQEARKEKVGGAVTNWGEAQRAESLVTGKKNSKKCLTRLFVIIKRRGRAKRKGLKGGVSKFQL